MKYYSSAATNKPTTVAAKNKKAGIPRCTFSAKNTPESVKPDKQKKESLFPYMCVLAFSKVSNLFLIW